MSKIYYAHSAKDLSREYWQTFLEHATNVAKLASEFAKIFNAQDIAYHMGLLHDLGKCCPDFDARLDGAAIAVEHAIAGAKIAVDKWDKLGKMMAFGIAGHHAGLANGINEGHSRSTLGDRLKQEIGKEIQLDPAWQNTFNLPNKITPPVHFSPNPNNPFFSFAFLIRMLYSCLVDADYLDTEAFYAKLENKQIERGNYPTLTELQTQFKQYLNAFQQKTQQAHQDNEEQKRKAKVNQLRSEILEFAVQQANLESGLFSLTVPTGGGKTFTSMAFALEHAKQHQLRRVIYVIPFTSIIEQNAGEFRKAFGSLGEQAVLEHHSAFDNGKLKDEGTKDKLRLASENWDMPVVVTTAVQFFESLFADRSSRCRKLHNIAGSVIILDEAQMLPLNLLRPIMSAIDELARNYKCSVVMCTATQPAIHSTHGFYKGFKNVREIAPNPTALFQKLRRTTVSHIGEQADQQLLEKLNNFEQILIILNNRRHARALYDQCSQLEGTFILSTLMCAEHRSHTLKIIRQCLKDGLPCRVIATSLIEAGVDVDFPTVMRAESGLDSVAQAAGRCNREGRKLANESPVWIFKPEEQWKTPPELEMLSTSMRSTVRQYADDLLNPDAIIAYFNSVYELKGGELDKERILQLHTEGGKNLDFPFQTIGEKFCMIKNRMLPIIIPFNQDAESLIKQLAYADKVGGILRKLQRYTVQVPESAVKILHSFHRLETLNPNKFGDQFIALIGLDLYDDIAGLSWDNPDFIKAENSVY